MYRLKNKIITTKNKHLTDTAPEQRDVVFRTASNKSEIHITKHETRQTTRSFQHWNATNISLKK